MLAHRIIPQLLCRGGQLIKGQQYESWRSVGVVAQAVRIHQMRQVDELLLLDIGATPEGRGPDLDMIKALAGVCLSPLTVGGGVRSEGDVRALLNHGADKVCIGTGAMIPGLVLRLSQKFGSSTIVVSVDVKLDAHGWRVCTECGKSSHILSPVEYAQQVEQDGAGEILLNSVDSEGRMEGYDLPLIEAVAEAVSIPVIASGGCSGYEDMRAAIEAGAHAVSAGALFQFTEHTPQGAAEYLDSVGLEARCV